MRTKKFFTDTLDCPCSPCRFCGAPGRTTVNEKRYRQTDHTGRGPSWRTATPLSATDCRFAFGRLIHIRHPQCGLSQQPASLWQVLFTAGDPPPQRFMRPPHPAPPRPPPAPRSRGTFGCPWSGELGVCMWRTTHCGDGGGGRQAGGGEWQLAAFLPPTGLVVLPNTLGKTAAACMWALGAHAPSHPPLRRCRCRCHSPAAARSLGCPKNTVDGEVLLGDLYRSGFDITDASEDVRRPDNARLAVAASAWQQLVVVCGAASLRGADPTPPVACCSCSAALAVPVAAAAACRRMPL